MKPSLFLRRAIESASRRPTELRRPDVAISLALRSRCGGTSLTEVLAALLLMSVGILGVMSLFPIAVIRSVQATRLTNATILAGRANTIIDMFEFTDDRYIPAPAHGHVTHAVIDPLGWHDMVAVSTGFAREYGNNGTGPVRYVPPIVQNRLAAPEFPGPNNNLVRDVMLTPVVNPPPNVPARGVPLRRLNFAVNPFGNTDATIDGAASQGGPYPPIEPPVGPGTLFGRPPSVAARDNVLAAVGLPDTYKTAFQGEPDATTGTPPTAVAFNKATTDLSYAETQENHPGATPSRELELLVPGTRIVIFDATGRRSEVRTLSYADVDGDTDLDPIGFAVYETATQWVIDWGPQVPIPGRVGPLAADFGPVGEVRIEYPESRYTWMLTVRKQSVGRYVRSNIDCVVFVNRPTGDPTQELVLDADQPTNAPDVPPTDIVDIRYATKPPFKKGGWIFDPQHCYWYRIIDVIDETPTTARLQLHRNTEYWVRNVIIPEGVVNVFPFSREEVKGDQGS